MDRKDVLLEAARAVRDRVAKGASVVEAVYLIAASMRLTEGERSRLARAFGLGL